jgi:hypothetical protein
MAKNIAPMAVPKNKIPLNKLVGKKGKKFIDHNELSVEMLKDVMPPRLHKGITPELLKQINGTITDPIALDQFRENLMSFTSVLKGGKFRLDHYICAVKYVSLLALGDNKKEAFLKTFPGKHRRIIAANTPDGHVKAYASSFHSTKIVTLLLEQMMVPVHLMNAAMFQDALNVEAKLMKEAKSEKVRCDAAAVLLQHLKPPETQKIELDVAMKEDDSIKALRETTLALARQQQKMIEKGTASTQGIATSVLIEEAQIVPGD